MSQTRSPSELVFGSLLVYAPQGTSETSLASQRVTRDIKNCRRGYIERIGQRLQELFTRGRFQDLLGPDRVLVPAPRSSPSMKHMHWPALSICQELHGRGLGLEVAPLLERNAPIQKSATAQSKQRPSPEDHAASMICVARDTTSKNITIVDDVVTRGATLLGCAWSLAQQLPDATICGLAVVRTMTRQEVTEILNPVDNGRIYLIGGSPKRDP